MDRMDGSRWGALEALPGLWSVVWATSPPSFRYTHNPSDALLDPQCEQSVPPAALGSIAGLGRRASCHRRLDGTFCTRRNGMGGGGCGGPDFHLGATTSRDHLGPHTALPSRPADSSQLLLAAPIDRALVRCLSLGCVRYVLWTVVLLITAWCPRTIRALRRSPP